MIRIGPDSLPAAARAAGLALAVGLLGLLALPVAPAGATPSPCPQDQGFAVCSLGDGDAALEVRATSLGGGQLLMTDLELDGIRQIGSVQGFALYDLGGGGLAASALVSATVDPATRTIDVQMMGVNGAFQVDASFVLTGADTLAVVDESFTVTALVDGLLGRAYAVTDYDIAGDLQDDSISSTGDGAVMTQVDGDTTGTVEVVGGPLPDGFEVAACCNLLDVVLDNVPHVLSGATSAPGPDDFVAALSWDRALDMGQVFQVSLRKTIVPEPDHALAAAAGALLALALGRRLGR